MSRQGATLGIYEKSYTGVKWKLWQYISPMGNESITDWRSSLTVSNLADLDTFLRNMAKKSKWAYPDVGGLAGKPLKGLHELRWRGEQGVPHRIGGYFAADNEFVMLIGWTHNKKKYDPPSALESLQKRKNRVNTGEASLIEYPILTGRTTTG
jgi:hypothetical protein